MSGVARAREAWPFLAPALVVLAAVAGWPLLRTVWLSFTDALLDAPGAHAFIGLENYRFLMDDPLWWQAVRNTLWFAAVSVTGEMILGVAVALLLTAAIPGRGLLRAAVLIPWAIPTVVSARLWQWMTNDLYGVFNQALFALGLIDTPVAWTADPDLALWTVAAVDVWKTTPFVALLTLAALQMVPRELYEAARVDGVHPLRVFVSITLPLIAPALLVAAIFRLLDALRVFDLIYVLTANSPATVSMSVYARQQLVEFQDVGLGSAAATLLFATVAIVTAVVLTAARLRGVAR